MKTYKTMSLLCICVSLLIINSKAISKQINVEMIIEPAFLHFKIGKCPGGCVFVPKIVERYNYIRLKVLFTLSDDENLSIDMDELCENVSIVNVDIINKLIISKWEFLNFENTAFWEKLEIIENNICALEELYNDDYNISYECLIRRWDAIDKYANTDDYMIDYNTMIVDKPLICIYENVINMNDRLVISEIGINEEMLIDVFKGYEINNNKLRITVASKNPTIFELFLLVMNDIFNMSQYRDYK